MPPDQANNPWAYVAVALILLFVLPYIILALRDERRCKREGHLWEPYQHCRRCKIEERRENI